LFDVNCNGKVEAHKVKGGILKGQNNAREVHLDKSRQEAGIELSKRENYSKKRGSIN